MTNDAKSYTYTMKGGQRPGYPARPAETLTGLTAQEFNEFKDLETFEICTNSDDRSGGYDVTSRKIGKGTFVFDICESSDDKSGDC